jgi:hypothetical protein
MTSAADPDTHTPFKLFRDLVDLVGIEPTTSSMPWKRAPSCATGPLFEGDTTGCPLRTALSILADLIQIVNAPDGWGAFLTSRGESAREMATRLGDHFAERKQRISRMTRSAWSVWKRN